MNGTDITDENRKNRKAYRLLLVNKTGQKSNAGLYLESEGYQVEEKDFFTHEAVSGRGIGFDMVLIETGTEDADTFSEVSSFRRTSIMPVILLIHGCRIQDRSLGISCGADDCLDQSDPLEMLAKVHSLLRRRYSYDAPGSEYDADRYLLKYDVLSLDILTARLFRDKEPVTLTMTEYRLLLHMMSEPGRVFSREELCTLLFGETTRNSINALMVHMSHLRGKLETEKKKYIANIRNTGYCFGEGNRQENKQEK